VSARRSPWRVAAHPTAIAGSVLRVPLAEVAIGERCSLQASAADDTCIGEGVVIALDHGMASIGLLQDSAGLSLHCVVAASGAPPSIAASTALLGAVLDGAGREVDRLAPAVAGPAVTRSLAGHGTDYRRRRPVDTVLATGVRAIDALLTCGEGQRIGIFAGAGAGKTTLAEMLLDNTDVDIAIVALVGERGREVATLVDRLRASPRAGRCIVVQATSDTAPAVRCNAALLAATLAEHFRDEGRRVLLVVDSITRYARALRELALGAGELPARRGYPASVFEALPRLLERAGQGEHGSITAFHTVLLEDEQDADPVGEEVKSLLDGHLYLSSRLAGRGHFPALDVLRSGSRLFTQLADPAQQSNAAQVRALLGTLDELQLMRELGEYKPGVSPHYDRAVAIEPALDAFLRQAPQEVSTLPRTREALHALVH